MKDSVFLDTNILVYLYSNTEKQKREISISLLKTYICTISTQVLNEFCNVLIKKYKIKNNEIKMFITNILKSSSLQLITEQIINCAIDLNRIYGYSYYDCLMLASALNSNNGVIFSEDLKDGQIIETKLKIINPFKDI